MNILLAETPSLLGVCSYVSQEGAHPRVGLVGIPPMGACLNRSRIFRFFQKEGRVFFSRG